MVISASETILPEFVAKERIREIIDNDPRVKSEIQDRINQRNATNSSALRKIQAAKHLTQQERNRAMESKKRELSIYDQYIDDRIFRGAVDDALP